MNQFQYAVTDATPVLLFSGTGNVSISSPSHLFFVGDSAVTQADGTRTGGNAYLTVKLSAPQNIYAIASAGQVADVRVLHWY